MRIRKAGKIDEGLWLLGTPESCVYLLEGKNTSALITAAMPYVLPELLGQFKQFGICEDKIRYLLILHAHFDHVGIAPFMKRRHRDMQLCASARAWEVLQNPRALDVMETFTKKVADRLGGQKRFGNWTDLDWRWRADLASSGMTLEDKQVLDLGGEKIEILSTPGHSTCSISAYVPSLKVLFPSDAAAIPYREEFIIAAGSSMETFMESLEKLDKKETRLVCADHYGCIAGDPAAEFIEESLKAARDMRQLLSQTMKEEASLAAAARKLVERHFNLRPDYFVDPAILMVTYEKMLKQYVR